MDYNLYYEAERKVGGRFKLAAVLQKRIVELMRGDIKLVDIQTDNLKEIAIHEVLQGKIELVPQEPQEGELSLREAYNQEQKFPLFDFG